MFQACFTSDLCHYLWFASIARQLISMRCIRGRRVGCTVWLHLRISVKETAIAVQAESSDAPLILLHFFLFRMIGDRLQGVKRKLRDQDADLLEVRCVQRQTVFNISLCKLRKNARSPDPILCRTVLIANTVRLIQREIEDESKNQANNTALNGHGNGVLENEASEANLPRPNSFPQHTRSRECAEDLRASGTFEKELNLLGDKISRSLEILSEEQPRLTTKQTVNTTKAPQQDSENIHRGSYRSEDTDREIQCGNLLGLELTEELKFSDVDVSLYDFDVQSFPVDPEEFCGSLNLQSTALPSRCCDSILLERKTEHAFDDLDQVMQILVGS